MIIPRQGYAARKWSLVDEVCCTSVSAVVVIVVVLIGQPLLTIVAITASVHSLSFFDF
jgi:hypothetical protein